MPAEKKELTITVSGDTGSGKSVMIACLLKLFSEFGVNVSLGLDDSLNFREIEWKKEIIDTVAKEPELLNKAFNGDERSVFPPNVKLIEKGNAPFQRFRFLKGGKR